MNQISEQISFWEEKKHWKRPERNDALLLREHRFKLERVSHLKPGRPEKKWHNGFQVQYWKKRTVCLSFVSYKSMFQEWRGNKEVASKKMGKDVPWKRQSKVKAKNYFQQKKTKILYPRNLSKELLSKKRVLSQKRKSFRWKEMMPNETGVQKTERALEMVKQTGYFTH